MISALILALPAVLGAALLLAVPGALVLRAAGVRGLALAAGAVPMATTLAAVTAVMWNRLGLGWGIGAYAIGAAVAAGAAWAVRLLLRKRRDPSARALKPRLGFPDLKRLPVLSRKGLLREVLLRRGLLAGAAAVAGGIIAYRYASGFRGLSGISQTFDNVYHLNAVRTILETGHGSSLTLGNLTPESRAFYPAAWHDATALAASALGLTVPEAVNAFNIVTGAVVWPLASLWLVTCVAGSRPAALLAAAAVIPAFPSFPYLMVDMGVLYPTHLATALLPAALAAVLEMLGVAHGEPGASPVRGAVVLAGVLPGMLLAHPSAFLALVALSLPLVAVWTRRCWSAGGRTRALACAGAGAYLAGGFAAWVLLRPPTAASTWSPNRSWSHAVGEILTGTAAGLPHGEFMLLLIGAGVLALITRQGPRWALGMFGMAAALYLIAAATPFGPVRTFFTGNWYNDPPRLVALLPVAAVPVAVVGAVSLAARAAGLWERAWEVLRRRVPGPRGDGAVRWRGPVRVLGAVLAAGAFVGAVGILQRGALTGEQSRINSVYSMGARSALISPDELRLIERLPALVGEDAVIVANPRNGESLVYALAGLTTLKPHIHGRVSADAQTLLDRWGLAGTDYAVCEAVKRTGARHALHFGPPYLAHAKRPLPGTEGLDRRPGVALVDLEGRARLYTVTGCG